MVSERTDGGQAPLLGEPLPVELMNTLWADREGVHDALRDPTGVAAWIAAVHDRLAPLLPPQSVSSLGPGDVTLDASEALAPNLRGLRDALRRLAGEVTADPRPAATSATDDHATAVAVINQACALAPTWLQLAWSPGGDPTQLISSAAAPAEIVMSVLGQQAAALFTGPQRPELRACLAPGCVLYFIKQHPRREWCSDGCGNRARVARHYQRHHPSRQ